METGLSELKELFDLKDRDLRTYSPLTLAYIGDGVYELVIRTVLVKKGNCPVNQLHKKASSLVKAGAQSKMMELLEPDLTEEELAVYKRGRNAHSPTMAKHATMADYRRATGFEALMGYLYLKEDYSRIVELVRKGIPEEEIWEEKVDQIRIYSGAKFEMIKEAEAGTVCAVTGLTETYPGEGLGIERESVMPVLEPVLNYQIILPEGCDAHKMLKSLKELEEILTTGFC